MNEEIALGVFNSAIWELYQKGEHRGGELIEKLRNREGLQMIDKKEKAQADRNKIYKSVQTIIAKGQVEERLLSMLINDIKELKHELAKVYFCMAYNAQTLRDIKTSKELYSRVAWSYMWTYEGWRESGEITVNDIYDTRAKFSTIERCIRFVKADMPHLFNSDILKAAAAGEDEARDTFGNSAAGL